VLERSRLAYLGLILLVGFLAYLGTEGLVYRVPVREAASPLNHGLYGTSDLVDLIHRLGYETLIVDTPMKLEGVDKHIVYIVVAPDKPFTKQEITMLKKLYNNGKLSLLVADETGIVNPLLETILGASIKGDLVRTHEMIGSGWDDFVYGECSFDGKTYTLYMFSRSSIIGSYNGLKPLCRIVGTPWLDLNGDGYQSPMEPSIDDGILIALGDHGGGRVVVSADSSIFTNYMVGGAMGIPPTRSLVVGIIKWLAGRGDIVFVFDNGHYSIAETRLNRVLLVIISLPAILVDMIWSIKDSLGVLGATLFLLFMAFIFISLTNPPSPQPRPRRGVDESRRMLASIIYGFARDSGDKDLEVRARKAINDPGELDNLIKYLGGTG